MSHLEPEFPGASRSHASDAEFPGKENGPNKPTRGRAGNSLVRHLGEALLLLGLLVLAFALRAYNLNFDDGTFQHPDERHWAFVLGDLEDEPWPETVGDYLNSETSRLNPYNAIRGPENDTSFSTFAYGTSQLYTTRGVAEWLIGGDDRQGFGTTVAANLNDLGIPLLDEAGNPTFNPGFQGNLVGRLLSALIDTATVGLVFLLGRELGGRRVAWLAALLQTFAVLHIQYAHFLGSEPWVAFYATATVLGAVRIARGRAGPFTWLATGVAVGLAVASKLSGLPTAIGPMVACAILFVSAVIRFNHGDTDGRVRALLTPIFGFGAMLVTGFLTFRFMLPYAFANGINVSLRGLISRDWVAAFGLDTRNPVDGFPGGGYLEDVQYIRDVNTGGNYPWVIQWAGRTPLVFPLSQVFWWGMGPGLACAAIVGMVAGTWQGLKRRQWFFLVPLSVIAVFVVFVALQFNPLNRYLLPAYPSAIALAGFGLVALWDSERLPVTWIPDDFFAFWKPLARISVGVMVISSVLWGVMYVNGVYRTDYTRITASQWIVDNIGADGVVSIQAWDDPLPLGAAVNYENIPRQVTFNPFDTDSTQKITQLVDGLAQVDYVIEASNKLYGAIPQMEARFPVTVRYYEALNDGSLGFERVKEFSTPPSLFGFTRDDRNAEETFTVYDHPTVTVWQKTAAFSVNNAFSILDPFRANVAVPHNPRDGAANALQLRSADYQTQQAGGTWSEVVNEDGFVTNVPWVWWLIWLQVGSFAALPLTLWLFKRFPNGGYGMSKVMGWAGLGLGVWFAVNFTSLHFTATLIWVLLAVGVVLALIAAVRNAGPLARLVADHWRSWLAAEAVFLSVFGLVLLLRYNIPDLWHPWRGGEKPMEMSYFTAILRSSTLPAYDPWYAGGFLNYYYIGWFLLAVPTKAMRMPPDIAFNLGVASYAALAAIAVHSLVSNLAGLARAVPVLNKPASTPTPTSAVSVVESEVAVEEEAATVPVPDAAVAVPDAAVAVPVAAAAPHPPAVPKLRAVPSAGFLGVLLFLFLGNFDAVRQHWYDLRLLATPNRQETELSDTLTGTIGETFRGAWSWLTGGDVGQFDWWDVSRVNKGTSDITEFPGWSVLFGDLHPHLMGLSIFGLLLGLATATVLALKARTVRSPETPVVHESRSDQLHGWVLAGSLGVVAALVRMVHTWDWPTAMVVCGVAIVVGWLLASGGLVARAVHAFGHLVVFALGYLVAVSPYSANSQAAEGGLDLFHDATRNLDDFVAHWFVFLVAAALYAVVRLKQVRRRGDLLLWTGAVLVAAPLFLYLHLRVGSVAAWASLGVVVSLLLVTVELTQRPTSVGHVGASGFFALGFGILMSVEFVRVAADAQGWNTVFKFWLQVWQLFAIASAFALWWVLRSLRSSAEDLQPSGADVQAGDEPQPRGFRPAYRLVALGLGVLILLGMIFPIRATRSRVQDRFDTELAMTLDGWAWFDEELPPLGLYNVSDVPVAQDVALVQWLRDNVEGSPTVVEAWGPGYQWFNRIPMLTGLPTVLGWDWHQTQQRTPFTQSVERRQADLRTFWTVPDPVGAEQFLRTYDVTYVIVGSAELATRVDAGVPIEPVMADSVEQMLATMDVLTPVFQQGRAVIYEVRKDEIRTRNNPPIASDVAANVTDS